MEEEYKAIKIKGALKPYKNTDPTMELVRRFEERSGVLGHTSLIKEATKFSRDLGLELSLTYPTPVCCTEEGEVVKESKIKQKLRSAQQKKLKDQVSGQAWQGKLIASRWEEEQGGAGTGDVRQFHSFSWLWQWRTCPTYVIAGIMNCTNSYFPPECIIERRQERDQTRSCAGYVARQLRPWHTYWLDARRLRRPNICNGIMQC